VRRGKDKTKSKNKSEKPRMLTSAALRLKSAFSFSLVDSDIVRRVVSRPVFDYLYLDEYDDWFENYKIKICQRNV
jgi:hypothetical protein